MFCLCNVASVTDFHDNTEKKKTAENKTTAKGGDALDFISQIFLLQVTPRDDAHSYHGALRLQLTHGVGTGLSLSIVYLSLKATITA